MYPQNIIPHVIPVFRFLNSYIDDDIRLTCKKRFETYHQSIGIGSPRSPRKERKKEEQKRIKKIKEGIGALVIIFSEKTVQDTNARAGKFDWVSTYRTVVAQRKNMQEEVQRYREGKLIPVAKEQQSVNS